MPHRDADQDRRAGGREPDPRLLRALIWSGAAAAALAALVVVVGDTDSSIRFAVLLLAVFAALTAAALLIRADPVPLRTEIAEQVAREVEAARADLRSELTAASAAQPDRTTARPAVAAARPAVAAARPVAASARPVPASAASARAGSVRNVDDAHGPDFPAQRAGAPRPPTGRATAAVRPVEPVRWPQKPDYDDRRHRTEARSARGADAGWRRDFDEPSSGFFGAQDPLAEDYDWRANG